MRRKQRGIQKIIINYNKIPMPIYSEIGDIKKKKKKKRRTFHDWKGMCKYDRDLYFCGVLQYPPPPNITISPTANQTQGKFDL